MGAENLLLTHFSARYPKMPPNAFGQGAPGSPGGRSPTLGIAFDHSRIPIRDMAKLNAYLPAIERYFDDTVPEEEELPEELAAAAAAGW